MSCRYFAGEVVRRAWLRQELVGRLVALVLLSSSLCAQPVPIPETTQGNGHYLFTVYTPTSPEETTLWQFGEATLTTHRLIDHSDSSVLYLPAKNHTTLRTYLTTSAASREVRQPNRQSSIVNRQSSIEDLLVYPTLLSPEQRQLTESYLALKHGLTLDQQRPTNYLAPSPDGRSYPVWTATTSPEFRHRILGLARDDASNLLRTTGNSVLAPELLELSWATTPDTTAYLVIADDGAPTARAIELDTQGLQRLQRRWRVETTGPVPPTTLSVFPNRLFAQLRTGENWVLLADDTIITPTQAGKRLQFELPTGTRFFQLAIAGATPISLPVTEDLFQEMKISPNPVRAGQQVQLRAVIREAASLVLSVHDISGRLLEERFLPAATHHLTEVSFPAPGSYTLHLRPRPNERSQQPHAVANQKSRIKNQESRILLVQ